MLVRVIRAALVALLGAASPGVTTHPATQLTPCATIPLLDKYARVGRVRRAGDRIELSVIADVHSADCGTPDCYGTQLQVVLVVAPEAGRCIASEVRVRSEEFVCGGDDPGPARDETFRMRDPATDLAALGLDKIVLVGIDRALIVGRENIFYYGSFELGSTLNERVRNDEDPPDACCFAAEQAEVHFTENHRAGARER